MTTKYTLQLQPIDLSPTLKPELLEAMRNIYMKYTGSEVAEAIKAIRVEIEEFREAMAIDQELEQLIARKTLVTKKATKTCQK